MNDSLKNKNTYASRSFTKSIIDWVMPNSWILVAVSSVHSITLRGKFVTISKFNGHSSLLNTNLYKFPNGSVLRKNLSNLLPFGSLIINFIVDGFVASGCGVSARIFRSSIFRFNIAFWKILYKHFNSFVSKFYFINFNENTYRSGIL